MKKIGLPGGEKINKFLFWGFLALGLFARLWLFGSVPEDINQDEAFAAYEAYSILTTGMDTAGYRFPVYLTAWGSGMNALESYLMLPFIALFGLKEWVMRFPQLLVGLLSLWVCYLTVRRMAGERPALLSLLLLAVSPWHVMLCRWGLESNLAPGFLIFGLYFFLRGLEDSRFLPLSALMYGLSLYAYATIWPFVPLMLLLQLLYCVRRGRIVFDGWLCLSGFLLLLLALPLLLFLLVNFGVLEEIRLPFLSIPRLLYMRSGEFSFSNIPENLKNLFRLLWRQSDGLPWNSAGTYGLIYPISLPFTLLGLLDSVRRLRKAGGREFCPEALLLIQLLAGVLLGALVNVNVNRVNIIFIPLIIFTAQGICCLAALSREWLIASAAALYLLGFLCFQGFYFGEYRETIRPYFSYGLESAMEAVTEDYEGTVYVSGSIQYPKILFYDRTDPNEFRETAEYEKYPAAFLRAESFGRWRFGWDEAALDGSARYILSPWDREEPFEEAGFALERFGTITIAYRN